MNIEQFLRVLPMIGVGMLGIFLVTGIIIGCIYLLNALTSPKKKG